MALQVRGTQNVSHFLPLVSFPESLTTPPGPTKSNFYDRIDL